MKAGRELGSRPRKVGTLKEQLFIGFAWNLASILKVGISLNSNIQLLSFFSLNFFLYLAMCLELGPVRENINCKTQNIKYKAQNTKYKTQNTQN